MGNFFTDIIENDPRAASTERISDLALLEPVTRAAVQNIIAEAKQMGIDAVALETYRSQQRQQQLYNEGTTTLKTVGVHHYGLACDIVKRVNGAFDWDSSYAFLGQLAKKHGLIWGGDWGNPNIPHTFIDTDHVQRCSIRRQQSLFAGDWYPEDNYNPYNDL